MTCQRLHWTTDNPSGMHRCQFQHPCVLILNCALVLAIYIFVGLILMLWHRETHINPQSNRQIIVDPVGIELTTSRLRQLRQLPVVRHDRFTPLKLCQKTQFQWHARSCIGQLTTRLECTGVNFKFLCRMQDSNLEVSRLLFASRLNAPSQTDWAIEDQAKKTWTQQPVLMMSEHSAHLTSLPCGFRT